jgi:hypothetical protein
MVARKHFIFFPRYFCRRSYVQMDAIERLLSGRFIGVVVDTIINKCFFGVKMDRITAGQLESWRDY